LANIEETPMTERGKQIVVYASLPLVEMLDRFATSYGMSRTQLVNEVLLPGYFREHEKDLLQREAERDRWGLTAFS
jgi:hypothetical protein